VPPVAIGHAPVERIGSLNCKFEQGAISFTPAHEQTWVATLSHEGVDETQVPFPEQSPSANWQIWLESAQPLASVHEAPLLLHPHAMRPARAASAAIAMKRMRQRSA
jgi:hypothetical protein